MSEELKAIDFLRAKTISYESDAKELHYSLILYNLIINLQQENQKYKEVIDKLNNLNNRIIEEYKLNYGDNPSKLLLALNTISDILKEVE